MKQTSLRFRLGRLALVLSPVFLSVACAKMSANGGPLANKASDTVGCQSFQEDFWNELYKFPQDGRPFPSEEQMRESFDRATQSGRLAHLSQADRIRVADTLTELYQLLALDSVKALGVDDTDADAKLETLTSLEIGDRTTDEKSALQDRIQAQFAKVQAIVDQQNLPACTAPKPETESAPDPSTLLGSWKISRNPIVYGALKTFAVTYQSCNATEVSALSTATPDLKGIKIVGTHKDGVGSKREISSLSSLVSSHPYLMNYKKPDSSCFEVLKSPSIYDYGGRPVTSSGAFDMFKNSGSGTSVLGTDCSGYVYMALATAGLKVKSNMTSRAVLLSGFSSRMYLDPQRNGMTCLDFAKFSGSDTLRPGDIIAKSGHVVIVGSVGKDPFGLNMIKSASDCTVKKMSTSRFDFTILQSSPSKNGIGIHSAKASSYLPESEVLTEGLLTHAVNACKAKFGTNGSTKASDVSIVRHSGSSSCKDKEVAMERQSCVARCPAAARTAAVDDLDGSESL